MPRLPRRRGTDYVRDAGDLCGRNTHDRGGNQWIFAPRNIATDRLNGDDLLAQGDARAELFEFVTRLSLAFREIGHLLLAEGEILLEHRAHGPADRADLLV